MYMYFMFLQVSVFWLKCSHTLHKQKFSTEIQKYQVTQSTQVNRKQDSSYTFVI